MPLGSPTFNANANGAANIGSLVGGSAQTQLTYSEQSSTPDSLGKAPIVLISVIILYLVWAVVVQQEKIKEQLSLSNVAVNFHNLVVVGLTAMVFILLGKIATAKATIMGLPGASWIAQLFQAV